MDKFNASTLERVLQLINGRWQELFALLETVNGVCRNLRNAGQIANSPSQSYTAQPTLNRNDAHEV
jgi:hypothetical protein